MVEFYLNETRIVPHLLLISRRNIRRELQFEQVLSLKCTSFTFKNPDEHEKTD